VLVAYRLLAPGSEWRLHREWFRRSALADLLAEIHKLYPLSRPAAGAQAGGPLITSRGRWRDLFNISYDVLLYDLTSNLLRGGSAVSGRRQAPVRVLARSPAGLCADRHCPPASARAGSGGDAPKACRWPMRCFRANTADKTTFAAVFSIASSGNTARRAASG